MTDPWPVRWGSDATGRAGVIVPLEGPLSMWRGMRLGMFHHLHTGEIERADAEALASTIDHELGYQFKPEGPGAYVLVRYADDEPAAVPPPPDGLTLFKHVSGVPVESDGPIERFELERTWFALADPAAGREKSEGLVVIIPGLFGTPEPVVDTVVKKLRARGWSVLRLMAEPSRFTQRIEVEIEDEDSFDAAARMFADELGGRAASCAYAVAEGVEYTRKARPVLADRPVVLMGMSGGAIALPAAHAWRSDLYDGAIFVAGGVNYLRIDLLSNYSDWIEAINITWPGQKDNPDPLFKPTRQQIDKLSEAYLAASTLDGHHLAPRLIGKPMLMIHGSGDRAVPAETGEVLWQRLGEPERWVLPVGHELIFGALPVQMKRINSWLDEQFVEHSETGSIESGSD